MTKMLTAKEVVELMRRRQGKRNQRAFAEELGISQQYLSEVYRGYRDPGESIVSPLGFKKVSMYEKVA